MLEMCWSPVFIVMPPTLKKLKGHIALGLCVRPLQILDKVLKFHRWTQHHKITDPYFVIWIISLCGVMPLLKGHNEIL